jgi:Zn-dependent alcohol dehydrogenase
MRIRAAVLEQAPGRFSVETLELEPPRRGEVRVRVVAAGVCHSDLHVAQGKVREPLPAVLGHEGAGIVEELGPEVDGVRVGQSVILAWNRNCGECRQCRAGRRHLCEEGIAGGELPAGGSRLRRGSGAVHHYGGVSCFATHAVLPETMVVPVEPGTDLETAALVGCAVTTGVGAVLRTARVPAGAAAVVVGCGGVGLSILQGLRLAGAGPIVAVDFGREKLELARTCGATHAVDAGDGGPVEQVRRITAGGADYAFEAVGLPETVRQAVAMTAVGGAAVVVGVPPDQAKVEIDLDLLWRGERRLLTSIYGSSNPRVDFPRLLALDACGRLDLRSLVRRRYPLERINEAYADLESGAPGRGILVMQG